MDSTMFIRLVRRTGSFQSVCLRFDKQTGFVGLARLHSLCENRECISIAKRDQLVVMTILSSRDWGHDNNRTITVDGLLFADDSWLTEIAQDVEHLEISGEHGAKGIMVKRQKSRDDAVQTIIDRALTKELVEEVAGWGLTISAKFELFEEIPSVLFVLKDGDLDFLTLRVDGWSGRVAIDEKYGGIMYNDPDDFRQLILNMLQRRLESATAVA